MTPADAPARLICVTPTRNENWIIRLFVVAAQRWADHLIIADQLSTDGTREYLQIAPGVDLVLNDSAVFDEAHRQQLLLDRARQQPGRRILIGLDADEALSANARDSRDWQRIQRAAPGTILRFRWANLLPGFERAWMRPAFVPFGFVDDGSAHQGTTIHSARVPQPPNAPVLDLEDIVVLHFQYVAWQRMASKQRWYQAWELTQHRQKGPLDIFRQYHHMHGSWAPEEIQPVRQAWLDGYEQFGIDFRHVASEPITWWDRELLSLLERHGPAHFRRLDIWNQDWNALAREVGVSAPAFYDPRSAYEKIVHRLLALTQGRRGNWGVRGFERALRLAGW